LVGEPEKVTDHLSLTSVNPVKGKPSAIPFWKKHQHQFATGFRSPVLTRRLAEQLVDGDIVGLNGKST
jgi:hypothetical protein